MSCATYWKYKGFPPAWEDLLSFSVTDGTEKINGLCLLGENKADTMSYWWDESTDYQLRVLTGTSSQLTIKTKKQCYWHHSGVFIVDCGHFWCFYSWLWAGNSLMDCKLSICVVIRVASIATEENAIHISIAL